MIESSMRRVQSTPVLSGVFRESSIWSVLPPDDYLDDDSPYDVLPTRDSSLAFLKKTTSLIQQLSKDKKDDAIVVDDKCIGLSENDEIVHVVDEKCSGLSENDVIVVDDKCSGLSENDGIVVDEKFSGLSENDDDEDIKDISIAVSKKISELSENIHDTTELKELADVFEVPDDSISSESPVKISLDVGSTYYVLPGLPSRDSNLVFMLKPTLQVSKESTDSGSSAETVTEDLEALQVPSEDSPGDTGDKVSTEKPETKLEQLRLLLEDEISHVNNLPCYLNSEDGLSLRNCSQRIKHKKRLSRNNVESSCSKLEAYLGNV